jgi:UDP-glucose 4-epimerase
MRLCIIGGAGYIGSHVAPPFQERGDSVTVFDDLSTGRRENVGKGALFLRGSILDVSALRSCSLRVSTRSSTWRQKKRPAIRWSVPRSMRRTI